MKQFPKNNLAKLSLAIGLMLLVPFASGQSFQANYVFDGSVTDENSGTDPTYIIQEVDTDVSEVLYTSGVDDQAVELDSASGFKLPMEVTDALMISDVWSLQMRFKITDFGAGDGQRQLISLKRSGTGTAPYFSIKTTKSSDSEGRVVFQMDDKTTRVQLYAFYFNLDEWVDLSFSIDFANQKFTLTGGTYTVSMNYTDFNYETFKTLGDANSLQNKQFFIGYYQNLAERQKSTNPAYSVANSANLIIDELIISDKEPETDASVYENALQQLTNHLNGDVTLTDTEISTYISEALSNYSGNYLTSKAIVDAYLEAYEASYEPLFNHNNNSASFDDMHDEFGWVQLTLYLDILDNYITNEHLSDVGELAFETADAFPGPVAETAERLDNQTVTVNGTFSLDPGYNGVINDGAYSTSARRGTSYYAAPGEIVTVEVPASLVGIGAEIVVGTFTQDVIGKIDVGIRRFPRPIKYFEINSETMQVMNPLGGIIYIYVPNGSALGAIDVTITGAVKFPYYEQSATNQTDLAEFQALVASGDVLWAEVVTDYFMYTAPITFFKRDDIAETVATWDAMWDAYQIYNGRPSPPHRPEHLVVDKMTQWNTLAGGYPMVLTWGTAPFIDDFWTNIAGCNMMNILDFDYAVHDNKATYWHEMTHHTNVPTLPSEAECIVELAYVVANNVGNNMPLDSAMKYSERGFYTRNDAIIDWVIEPNFRNNEEMTGDQRKYQQRGYSKYVDIGALFGWDSLGLINKVFYDDWTAMGGQDQDPDGFRITDTEWILASCEALDQNIAPLYHFWGEQPHDTIFSTVNAYPRSKEVYLRLREIRNFIPKTAEEFQPYYDARSTKQTYIEALAGWETDLLYDSIIMEIDSILYWYYDADFDQDGYLFYDDCDDTDASIFPYDLTVDLGECENYEFDGNLITTSGTYNGIFTTVHGCDSLVTLNLTILQPTESNLSETVCDSYDFLDTILTSSGVFQETLTNSVGCDSLVTLDLTVLKSTSSEATIEACTNYEWNGVSYTTSGIYQELFTNAAGCDSTATLNLTINTTSESTTDETACNSYDWNGKTFTESGTYQELFINSVGCDSTAILNLIINHSSESTSNETACDSYDWNGKTFTESGTYNELLTNMAGCDSTATLHLTINSSMESTINHIACNNYEWNGVTYTSSGVYETIFTNLAGCDSVATLNLTIQESLTSEEHAEACENYSWNGQTYGASGIFWTTLTSTNGCDSTAFLHLTILDPTSEECNESITSVPAIFSEEVIYAHPNPTNGMLTIELGATYKCISIEIRTLTGRLIHNDSYEQTNQILTEIEGNEGIYILQIIDEQRIIRTERIVKSN